MHQDEIIPSIVISAHALARITAQTAQNEAPAAQWRVLSILERETGQRVGALARAARTTQPGMTRLLGELEREGLLVRSSDPTDSRAAIVDITESGLASLNAWRQEFRTTLSPRFVELDAADWRALARSAEILAAYSTDAIATTGANA